MSRVDGDMETLWVVDGVDQGRLKTELTFERGADTALLTRDWLERTLDVMGGPFTDALRARPLMAHPNLIRRTDPFGDPGSPWAHIRVQKTRSVSLLSYTEANFRRALKACDDLDAVTEIAVDLSILDERGFPGLPRLVLGAIRLLGSDRYVSLFADLRDTVGQASLMRPSLKDWVALSRTFADSTGLLWGCVALDAEGMMTSYEASAGSDPTDVVRAGQARGASWVTVLGATQLPMVGGMDSLAASGAFDEISELGNGSLWLQATKDPSDYVHEKWRAVHVALRDALPEPRYWAHEVGGFGHRPVQLVKTLAELDA